LPVIGIKYCCPVFRQQNFTGDLLPDKWQQVYPGHLSGFAHQSKKEDDPAFFTGNE
jgi:hypothetical protein